MRLEIGDLGARLAGDGLQRLQLFGEVADQVGVPDLDVGPAEVLPVAVRRLGSHLHVVRDRQLAHRPHRRLVPRMEAAGDVGLRHEREQIRVGVEALADVRVQVVAHRHAAIVTRLRRCRELRERWGRHAGIQATFPAIRGRLPTRSGKGVESRDETAAPP